MVAGVTTIVLFLFSQHVRVVTAVRRGRRAGRRICALSVSKRSRSKGDNDDDGDGRNDDHGDDGGE